MPKEFKPFSSASDAEEFEDYLVEDGRGSSVEIPKIGALTVNEHLAVEEARISLYGKEGNRYPSQAKVDFVEVVAFLRERFDDPKINSTYVTSKIREFSLIKAIHEFLKAEQRQWAATNTLIEFQGDRAKTEAIAFTERNPGTVAATRGDLASFKRWVVFRSRDDVPEDYTIEGEGKENPQFDKQRGDQ